MVGLTETGGRPADRLSAVVLSAIPATGSVPVSSLEIFFDSLLALMAVLITWFAIFSVMKLYQGQR
ncbi:hypothetical protein P3T39_003262 [Kitasatospora sp. GP82]|nr:hypothetical protein [Kitasatospora sp. GP82]